jgi:hypothetical protein
MVDRLEPKVCHPLPLNVKDIDLLNVDALDGRGNLK